MRLSSSSPRLRRLGASVVMLGATAALAAGGAFAGPTAASKTIQVGSIGSFTGLGGVFSGYQAGIKAFFSYTNERGGIKGYRFQLNERDDAADPAKNSAAARELVQQKKILALVTTASCAGQASQKYLQQQNVPVIGWQCGSEYVDPGKSNMFLNYSGSTSPFCSITWEHNANGLGLKREARIALALPAAGYNSDCHAAAARYYGMEPVGKRIDAAATAVDFRPFVQEAMSSDADVIAISHGTDGILKTIIAGEQLGYTGVYLAVQVGADLLSGLKSAGLLDKVNGRVISEALSLLPSDANRLNPELARFKTGMQKYQKKYASDPTAVNGWAAGVLFVDALKAVGPDKAKIVKWIQSQRAYTARGLLGPMNYTKGSRPVQCTTHLVLEDGQFVRSKAAAAPPKFSCGPLIDVKSAKVKVAAPKQ